MGQHIQKRAPVAGDVARTEARQGFEALKNLLKSNNTISHIFRFSIGDLANFAARRLVGGSKIEQFPSLSECESEILSVLDKVDALDDCRRIGSIAGGVESRWLGDQSFVLVESNRVGGYATCVGDLADFEVIRERFRGTRVGHGLHD